MNFVLGDGERQQEVSAAVIGRHLADHAGFEIFRGDLGRSDGSAGRVGDQTGDAAGNLGSHGWGGDRAEDNGRSEQDPMKSHAPITYGSTRQVKST